MDWKTMLSYISEPVDEELLLPQRVILGRESRSSKSDPGSFAPDRWRTAVSGRARKASAATSHIIPRARCAPVNGLAGCSVSTIGKPHEYFDLTATLPVLRWLRGRDRPYGRPPAQIPASAANALGGTYDVSRDEALVNVDITHETAEFAVESIRRW